MSVWIAVADLVGALLLLIGAFLCFAAALGLVRLPDILSRMHAATKPQTLGLLLILGGLALTLRTPAVLGLLGVIGLLQLLTAPVSAHLIARAAYRTGQVPAETLHRDELAEDRAAGESSSRRLGEP